MLHHIRPRSDLLMWSAEWPTMHTGGDFEVDHVTLHSHTGVQTLIAVGMWQQ